VIKWNEVAEELAVASYDDLRLSSAAIEIAAATVFYFKAPNYATNSGGNPPESYRLIRNNVIALGQRKGYTEKEKVQLLIEFATKLYLKKEYILDTVTKAGYVVQEPIKENDVTTFGIYNFHPEIVAHCEKFFCKGIILLLLTKHVKPITFR
jgi:hypothetical protein